jgi:hypothetical protein
MPQPKDPARAFWDWFSSLPAAHQEFVAHAFWICTTDDSNDLILTPRESLAKFGHYVTRPDFPLRVLSRMVVVRGVVNFILTNRESFENKSLWPGAGKTNVVFLSEAQWAKHLRGWRLLLSDELSDASLSFWVKAVTR